MSSGLSTSSTDSPTLLCLTPAVLSTIPLNEATSMAFPTSMATNNAPTAATERVAPLKRQGRHKRRTERVPKNKVEKQEGKTITVGALLKELGIDTTTARTRRLRALRVSNIEGWTMEDAGLVNRRATIRDSLDGASEKLITVEGLSRAKNGIGNGLVDVVAAEERPRCIK